MHALRRCGGFSAVGTKRGDGIGSSPYSRAVPQHRALDRIPCGIGPGICIVSDLRRSGSSWRSSGPGSTICADDLRREAARSPRGQAPLWRCLVDADHGLTVEVAEDSHSDWPSFGGAGYESSRSLLEKTRLATLFSSCDPRSQDAQAKELL